MKARWAAPLLGLAVALSAAAAVLLSREPGSVATLWVANTIASCTLLARARAEWPALLLATALGNVAGNLLVGDALPLALAFVPGNLLEIMLCVALLQRHGRLAEALQHPLLLVRVLLLGAVLPTAFGALLGAGVLQQLRGGVYLDVALTWFQGGLLGALSLLPLGLLLAQRGPRPLLDTLARPEVLALLLLSLAVAIAVPTRLPFPFIYTLLPLVLLSVVGGLEAAALGVPLVAMAVGLLVASGLLQPPASPYAHGELLLNLPLLLTLLPPLLLGAAQSQVRLLLARLRDSEASYRSLYQRSPAMLDSVDPQGRLVAVSD